MNESIKIQTPCFLFYEQEFISSIKSIKAAFGRFFSKVIIGYSVKTNSLPYCLKIAREQGCYAEVVSYNEYLLALKCNFSPDKIIYNGPLKSKETFLDAIVKGAIVNIETFREIEWLKELPRNGSYKVGLRLNIDISRISPGDQCHENDDSRFGFSFESGEFQLALERIKKINTVRLSGIHTHRTSRTRSPLFYKNVLNHTNHILNTLRLNVEYLDIGGGYFGKMPDKPTFEDYANEIYKTIRNKDDKLTLILEPGNALTASSFEYLTSIIDVKEHIDKYFITTDGTRNDIDPFYRKTDYFKEIIMKDGRNIIANKEQIVGGCTCLENDRIFSIEKGNKLLQVGDQIKYHRVGAYTMCLSPMFIHYFPIVYSVDRNKKIAIVRQEWTENEFIQKSNL